MRYKHLLTEQQLDELRMSPSSLRNFANSREAEGIKAGFEAELIFPGLGDSDGGESEPDYDADERAYSIEDIINFFEYDDYGYGLSGREADRLRNDLDEQWMEYFDEAMYEAWHGEALSLVRDVIENTDWDADEQIREYLSTEYPDLDVDEIIKKAQEATSTRDTPAEYQEAANAVAEALEERAEESLANQDQYYDEALDNFRDNFNGASEEDWLRENYRYMSDVADAFGLTWPYVRYDGADGEYNEYAADQLADSLKDVVGMRVIASSGYHSTTRSENRWIIEPDSSLEGNDSDDMPAEIVSPPMPLNQCLEMMDKFFDWAKSHRAYSNSSTGFHMGVSLPHTGGKVDFIKLALFLGDEHVLEEFGRSSNHFTEAAMKKIRSKVKQTHNSEQVGDAMNLMRNGLIELATKALKVVGQGGFGKYTSINPKDNYIEFRSAGGEDYSDDVEKLKSTLLRYAQAMTIAANPAAERKEYYKKLYKLISPAKGDASIDLFARFASGNISKEELKKQWAEAALEKEAPQLSKTGTWKVFDKSTGKALPGYQYSGYTESEALALVKQAMSPGSTPFGFKQAFDEKYELRNVSASTGKWAIIDRATGETLEVVDSENRGDAADLASEKYAGQDYYIEPVPVDTPKPKLSRRAELAKRIKTPKDKPYTPASYHVRLKAPTDPENYRAVGTVVQASDPEDAIEKARLKWNINSFGWNPEEYVATLTTDNAQKQQTLGPGQHWEIYSINTGTALKRLEHTNRAAAAEEARTWIRMHNGNVEDFAIRAAGSSTQVNSTPAGADVQWRVTNTQTGDSSIINAPSRLRANAMVMDLARRMGVDFESVTIEPYNEPIPGSTLDLQRQRAAQQQVPQGTPVERRPAQATNDAGIPMWEIYNRYTGDSITHFPDHNQTTAWASAQTWAREQGYTDSNMSALSVRPVMQQTNENLKLTKTVLEDLDNWLSDMKLPKGFSK